METGIFFPPRKELENWAIDMPSLIASASIVTRRTGWIARVNADVFHLIIPAYLEDLRVRIVAYRS